MSSKPPAAPSKAERALLVAGGLALSALFFWLFALLLVAPIDGPVVARWSLRAFSSLMFGSIGLLGLAPLVGEVRMRRALAVLRHFDGRCLGCGLRREGSRACDRCGHPFDDDARYWTVSPDERGAMVIGAGVAGAILSLGVFMGAYALESGPLLGKVFIGALALVIGLVGLVGTLGALAALREERPTHPPRITYSRAWTLDGASWWSTVSVTDEATGAVMQGTAGGGLASDAPLDASEATAFERGLAWRLSRCAADGRVRIRSERSLRWTARPSGCEAGGDDGRRAYRSPAKLVDEVERVERDTWYIDAHTSGPAAVLAELGLAPDTWDDLDAVEVSSLVDLAARAARGETEASDPGAARFADPDAATALRAVLDARRYSGDGAR